MTHGGYSASYPSIAEAIAGRSEWLGEFIGRLDRLSIATFALLGSVVYWPAPQLIVISGGTAFLASAAVVRSLVWTQVV